MVYDTWEDADRLFRERHVQYHEEHPTVPRALKAFAFELLDSCRIPFDQADRGVLFLLDVAREHLIIVGQFGTQGPDIVGRVLTLEGSPLGQVVHSLKPLLLDDTTAPVQKSEGSVHRSLSASSCLFAPIADQSACLGVFGLFCRDRTSAFCEFDVSRLVRKGKYAVADLKMLLAQPKVAHWYHRTCEALSAAAFTEEDVHVLLDVFGMKLTTQNAALATALTSDVGEAVRGLGIRVGSTQLGGAKRYSADDVRTILTAFGVEVTAGGGGRLSDLLTTDLRGLLRTKKRGPTENAG